MIVVLIFIICNNPPQEYTLLTNDLITPSGWTFSANLCFAQWGWGTITMMISNSSSSSSSSSSNTYIYIYIYI